MWRPGRRGGAYRRLGPRRQLSARRADHCRPHWIRARRRSIRATGFCPKTPISWMRSRRRGWSSSARRADAIRAMGLKDAAKALMEKAGVPVVPGYHGSNQDPEHLAGAADAIGYPVLIKAVAGGGGKGMRLVETPARFAEALESARSEAQNAFGNARCADREIRRETAPYRGAGLWRRDPRGASVRARLFAPAPPPEGDRGGARAGHDRRDARRHGPRGRARG